LAEIDKKKSAPDRYKKLDLLPKINQFDRGNWQTFD